jgi:hypothetical protein
VVAAARPSGAQAVVVAEQPWVAQVVEAAQRAAALAEEAVQPLEARVAEAVRPSAVQVGALVLLSEVRAAQLSAEPSVRLDRPVRARLARRRWTTVRRKPGPAKAARRPSQLSSAEGIECSSWGLWGEKKVKQPESCRPSQRSELRSVDSDWAVMWRSQNRIDYFARHGKSPCAG